jgi:hypothetical protein
MHSPASFEAAISEYHASLRELQSAAALAKDVSNVPVLPLLIELAHRTGSIVREAARAARKLEPMTLSTASSATPMLARQDALAHSLEAARRATRASAEAHEVLSQLADGEPQASGLTVLVHIATTTRYVAEAAKVLGQVSEDNPASVAQAARDLCVQAALAAGAATRLSCSLASSLAMKAGVRP